MSEKSRFQQKLIRLASSGTSRREWRNILPPQPGDLLAALLLEIDNTVLPRQLSFRSAQDKTLTCTAANRRLATFEDSNGTPISPTIDDVSTVTGLHTRLTQFLSGQEKLSVKSEPIPRDSLSGTAGISAEKLAALWQVSLSVQSHEDPAEFVSSFLDCHRSRISAWCRKEDGRIDTGGNPEAFGVVQELLTDMERTLDQSDGPARTLAPNGFFLILDDCSGGGNTTAFATLGTLALALLASDSDMATLSSAWQQACATNS